jgi:hypothetical protein
MLRRNIISALLRTEVRTLSKIHDFIRISLQAFSTHCCNTRALNTPVFRFPHSQKSDDLSQGIVQTNWLFIWSLVQVLSENEEQDEMVPHDARNTRVVVDEKAYISTVLVNHSPISIVCWIKQLILRGDHLRCPPKHTHHTSTGTDF